MFANLLWWSKQLLRVRVEFMCSWQLRLYISAMSSTTKSVVDETGESSKSLIEFMDWLFGTKSQPIRLCVNMAFHGIRKHVEKGTAVVSKLLAERGFVGSWKIVNMDNGDD